MDRIYIDFDLLEDLINRAKSYSGPGCGLCFGGRDGTHKDDCEYVLGLENLYRLRTWWGEQNE